MPPAGILTNEISRHIANKHPIINKHTDFQLFKQQNQLNILFLDSSRLEKTPMKTLTVRKLIPQFVGKMMGNCELQHGDWGIAGVVKPKSR
ncbi:hypothetical protein C8P68_10926 [Mucilaginibacter yixingensis]|uniref:Uncharacterized protein n=1 Tax=Mucilaginibacter yixingensis TaxID=1295612 RepID=A0A2T5J599_9SPHI|nr:hypothetical protein [Mucilaginibacter yixingensis]PTQ93154.1 hypothetical protein C8P68_10926 [Mucilaginibacter yixingensis]